MEPNSELALTSERTISRRQWLGRAGLVVGVGLLAACAPAAPVASPTAVPASAAQKPAATAAQTVGGTPDTRPFVFAAKLEAPTLDPNVSDGSYYRYPGRAMYEPLVDNRVGADGKVNIVGVLAEKWDISADARTYTFTLRNNVKFQDGTPLNAEAVKWTFDRLVAQKTPVFGRLPPLDAIEAVNPTTIRFVLTSPSAPFLASMTLPLIISPSAGSHDAGGDMGKAWLDTSSVGTGPYKLEQWVRGQQISLVKNPDYWQGWSGNHVEKVVVRLVKEPATQRQLLETGDAHMADGISFDDLDALTKAPGVVVQREVWAEILNMGLNTSKPPFDKVEARQAAAYAFDYDGYIKGVLNGRGRQPLSAIPFGSWALDETAKPYTRDIEKAKQLIAKAGVPAGTKIRITTISPFGWYQPRQAQILQQNLKELGIDAAIDDKSDAATFVAALQDKENGPNVFFYEAVQALDDPDYELRRLFHSASQGRAGRNGSWYSSKQFDDLLDKALTLPERKDRKPLYDQIQKILSDDAPAIWPGQIDFYVTRRDSVRGFVWNPFSLGVPNFYDLWIAK